MCKTKNYDYDWENIFEYSERSESGLIWKIPRIFNGTENYERVGKMAGSITTTINKNKYWSVGFSGRIKGSFLIHRIIWILKYGKIPENYDIDHLDQNSLNNKIENLRCIEKKINMRNKKLRTDNKVGHVGIYLINNKNSHGYFAYFKLLNNKNRTKLFSFKKYSKKEALILAKKWHKEQNKELEGYTNIHGIKNE